MDDLKVLYQFQTTAEKFNIKYLYRRQNRLAKWAKDEKSNWRKSPGQLPKSASQEAE